MIPINAIFNSYHDGQINLYQFQNSSLSQLSVGDRIKVIGAVSAYGSDGEVELYMRQWSSVVKLSPSEDYVKKTIMSPAIPEGASKRVGVGKRQVKGGIEVRLKSLSFFKDYTEADISIK
jgi:hypothetical protein